MKRQNYFPKKLIEILGITDEVTHFSNTFITDLGLYNTKYKDVYITYCDFNTLKDLREKDLFALYYRTKTLNLIVKISLEVVKSTNLLNELIEEFLQETNAELSI